MTSRLSRSIRLLSTVLLLSLPPFSSVSLARSDISPPELNGRGPRALYANRAPNLFTHQTGLLSLQVTNLGIVGNPFISDVSMGWQGGEYLFACNLWIGARSELDEAIHVSTGIPTELRPSLLPVDTIYPSMQGFPGGNRRGWPGADDDGDGAIDEDFHNGRDDDQDGLVDEDFEAFSDQMFSCEYWDNTPEAINQVSNHHPLDVKVSQRSFAWTDAGYNEFIGFDFTVRNIGEAQLRDLYVGLFVDADAGVKTVPDYWTDDGGEHIHIDSTLVGEAAPGDCTSPRVLLDLMSFHDVPDGAGTATGDDVEGYLGVVFLGHPTDSTETDAPANVGPRTIMYMKSSGAYPEGEPRTDIERYDLLADRGVTNSPAGPPADYRGMISIGPFAELAPGGTLNFQAALVIGEGRAGLIENTLNLYRVYSGMCYDADNDPLTGVDGREAVLNWVLPSEYTPVTFLEFSATPRDDGILLAFRIDPDLRVVSAYLERQSDSGTWSRIGPEDIPVAGDGRASLLDTAVLPGERYRYRVALLMPDGSLHRSAEFESEPFGIPAETVSRLLAPFPNPAEHEVWIPFRVTGGSAAQRVTIRVLDAAGRLVRDLYTSGVAGSTSGSIVWDGRDDRGRQVPAGFYLAVLETSTGKAVRKIVIRR